MKDIEDIKDIVDIKDIENIESRENKKSKKTEINNSMEEKRTFENIDELLSLEDEDSENEDIKPYSLKNDTKTDSDNDYEDIKNSINNLVPSVISEINKELDTQKALLDENTIEIETPIINDIKKKGDKSTKNDYSIKDLTEDDEDDVDMSSLGIYKKIHITFYGYKLLPNQQFARIYPITLEVPETAKFKTVFKAYCAGTQLNEDDMLFNYNNIEIFSTSTLKGLDMTSSLENYRIGKRIKILILIP
ncbi:hypothetical protein BCR36DRAFT_20488 [Piromyces finnis]|uniref:Ubiquitin-like domain-containing protein n=1 Tax=Piromyces finnis TaxID=1754191 RepID=A0A1Y1VFN1_9FUNG|nr:hypothetical protein BCR36DRAFT_20488 [Piromyces finnis]|eukprot:ORX53761.1 hypothetical protein BCR36DRAFT_20488 [Piromyces finnis]